MKGTGAGGRITKQDVEAYIARRLAAGRSGCAAAPPRRRRSRRPPPAAPPRRAAPAAAPRRCAGGQAKTRIEPMSTMRQKIAEHMVMSKRTSPHVTTVHRVDMTKVAKMRERHKAHVPGELRLLADVPAVHHARLRWPRCGSIPLLNASLDGNNIIYHNEINIGIAVALENGLIVPVIRDADEKNVLGLQRSIVDLAARARSRQLKPDEVVGRHVLHHQLRQLRQPDRDAGDQSAAGRDPRRRHGGQDAGGDRRRDRDPLASAISR